MCYYYYRYSTLGPVWAETRAQAVDWYSSGTLRTGQVLRGASHKILRSMFRNDVQNYLQTALGRDNSNEKAIFDSVS